MANEAQKTTKETARYLARRLHPEKVDAALKKVELAETFALLYWDGGEDPDSDFVSVLADGEEVAVVWN